MVAKWFFATADFNTDEQTLDEVTLATDDPGTFRMEFECGPPKVTAAVADEARALAGGAVERSPCATWGMGCGWAHS